MDNAKLVYLEELRKKPGMVQYSAPQKQLCRRKKGAVVATHGANVICSKNDLVSMYF
jgi:hypothetical protein